MSLISHADRKHLPPTSLNPPRPALRDRLILGPAGSENSAKPQFSYGFLKVATAGAICDAKLLGPTSNFQNVHQNK